MAALMTCDRDDTSKLSKCICECQVMDLPVLPPHINESTSAFVATSQGIRFAMTGIKGVGEGVVEAIIEERSRSGPFVSYLDFFERMDLKRVGKKIVEHLIFAGAFDWTLWTRPELVSAIEEIYEAVIQGQKERSRGILTLFSLSEDDEMKRRFSKPPPTSTVLAQEEIYRREKELLGFYITGNPLQGHLEGAKRLGTTSFSELEVAEDRSVRRIMAIVESIEIKHVIKTMRKFAIVKISDGIQTFDLFVFSDLYEQKRALIEENRLLYAVVSMDRREETAKLIAVALEDLKGVSDSTIRIIDAAYDRAKQSMASRNFKSKPDSQRSQEKMNEQKNEERQNLLTLSIELAMHRHSTTLKLKELFAAHPGASEIKIHFLSEGRKYSTLFIDKAIKVNASPLLLEELKALGFIHTRV